YRMSNVVAGIGRGQLLHLDEHRALKEAIYNRYKEGFKDMAFISMNPYLECTLPNFWLSCMLIDRSVAGKVETEGGVCEMVTKISKALAAENIETRPIWKPMHMQPVYKDCDFITANGEDVGKDVFERGICLPSDIKMTDKQQEKVIDIIKSCF
ncbi:MAG: DegT/DnrJ/EryC1/StrS family aminotransferase, partial [Lachnospiraceae bacterium]|nr:DegT/DnrJ/EryC1/StrS family aminotransferase [Lachnospiraceae bacterium]